MAASKGWVRAAARCTVVGGVLLLGLAPIAATAQEEPAKPKVLYAQSASASAAAQVAPGTLSVSKTTGLKDGDEVTVSGTGWPAGATFGFGMCRAVVDDGDDCDLGLSTTTRILADGSFTKKYNVASVVSMPENANFSCIPDKCSIGGSAFQLSPAVSAVPVIVTFVDPNATTTTTAPPATTTTTAKPGSTTTTVKGATTTTVKGATTTTVKGATTTTAASGSGATTTTTAAGALADTGARDTGGLALIGLGLLFIGGGTLVSHRRPGFD